MHIAARVMRALIETSRARGFLDRINACVRDEMAAACIYLADGLIKCFETLSVDKTIISGRICNFCSFSTYLMGKGDLFSFEYAYFHGFISTRMTERDKNPWRCKECT